MTESRINIMDEQEPAAAATPQAAPRVVYAPVTERFVALLIDYGVVFIPCHVVGAWVLKSMADSLEWWHFAAVVCAMNLLFILYEAVFSSGDRVTLGKSLVGIAVVRQDLSGPVSFPRAFLRAVGYYVSAVLFMCGFLWAFFDDRRRALHDFLGGSVVVQIRQKAGWERWAVRAAGGILLLIFGGLVYTQYFSGDNWLDKTRVRQARIHLQKIALLEEAHRVRYGYYTNDLLRLSLLSGDPVQFQRDTRKVLEPKGFKIGVKGESYKISAVAKDTRQTRVAYANE